MTTTELGLLERLRRRLIVLLLQIPVVGPVVYRREFRDGYHYDVLIRLLQEDEIKFNALIDSYDSVSPDLGSRIKRLVIREIWFRSRQGT